MKQTKLKILCLFIFIGFAILLFTNNRRFVHPVTANSAGAPPSVTGAPGETTCVACHSNTAGAGEFTITAPPNYTPGQTYQIQVRHVTSDSSRRRWGFELTALANNAAAGGFTGGGATQTFSENGRNYVSHTTAGTFANQTGGALWTFSWTAPASNVGAVTFYAAGNQANNDGNTTGDRIFTTNVAVQPATQPPTPRDVAADFDGDGKTDVSVFRPAVGTWYLNRSASGFFGAQFGIATDKPAPADYDGDDKTDLAVWRENGTSQASFYILNSSTNALRADAFGTTGDIIAVGDWDGDGKADPAVYRPGASGGQGFFFYRGSLNNPNSDVSTIPWGIAGDAPVRGDFDGDGKFDAAVFRPAGGFWYIRQSSNGALFAVQWGIASDKRVAADYDGDAKTDIAVFRDGNWFVRQSSNGNLQALNWGLASDVTVPGDYDGDAKADVAVYRGGAWYIRLSSNGNLSAQNFGLNSDIAVPSLYVQ